MTKKKIKTEPAIMRYYPEKDYKPESKPFPLYEDKDYKLETKPFPLYEDETLESKRKGGMMKKAFMGLAVEAARKSPMGLIGVGADKILKKSGTARELAGSLGMGGKLLKQYYDKEDSKDKKTGSEQTTQVVAKRDGGMVRGGRAEIKGTRPAKLT